MQSSSPYDEKALLKQLSEGDEEAFNLLFGRYRNQLFSYLVKITKSKETAEEVVLDVFLKIWTGRSLATEISSFEGFLFRVAHNKAIDFLRSTKRVPAAQNELWDKMQELSTATHSDHRVLEKETEEQIQVAIGQLSPQRQKVFQLRREEGLSYDEIAEKLQLSRNTVRNHIAYSLQFIRNYLKAGGPDLVIIGIMLLYPIKK